MENTKTGQFLLPILGYTFRWLVEAGLLNVYLGHHEEIESFGEKLYLLMEPPKKNLLKLVPNIEEYEQTLKSHPYYEKTLKSVTDNRVVYVFKIPDEMILKVIKPFIRGKYSKIDQNYVDKNFAPIVTIGGMRVKDITYSILKREVWLKNYWEDRLDTELDKDAELASIIDPETETYWGGDTLSIAESRVI